MKRVTVAAGIVAALAFVGAGTGIGVAVTSTAAGTPGGGSAAPSAPTPSWPSGYPYAWMMGGTTPPGWATGGSQPGWMTSGGMMGGAGMMGGYRAPAGAPDIGTAMGSALADAPGPRVSAADAAHLAGQIPQGASVDPGADRVSFTGPQVAMTVVAGLPGASTDDSFEVAGLVDPTIVVPSGTQVSIQVVNADSDTAHGLVITRGGVDSGMPMMTAPEAFPGAAVWALGESTPAGMHTATVTFTATAPGTYSYLCAIPGHARKGMAGTFLVQGA